MRAGGSGVVEKGEIEAFEAFAAAVTPRLRRSARLLSGDPALAEDLVQTVLLKLYLHWGRSGTWDSPVAYAQRVLYTTFCAWAGRRWTAEVPTGDVPDVASPDAFEGSDTGAVHSALLSLTRRQRAVLVARFYDDLSVEQTSALLGWSPAAVKGHTARGLEQLRVALSPRPANVEDL